MQNFARYIESISAIVYHTNINPGVHVNIGRIVWIGKYFTLTFLVRQDEQALSICPSDFPVAMLRHSLEFELIKLEPIESGDLVLGRREESSDVKSFALHRRKLTKYWSHCRILDV